MERFVGKIAVVTGASRGIGEGISKELLKQGVHVVGTGRNIAPLQEMANEVSNDLSKYTGKFYFFQCDITEEAEVVNTFQKIRAELGPIWILVNNAGGGVGSSLREITGEAFEINWNSYTKGMLMCCREALKSMTEISINGGHILNIISIDDREFTIHHPDSMPGICAKTAQRALSEGLRREIVTEKLNIKVTDINPGFTKTALGATYDVDLTEMNALEVQDIADACIAILDTPVNVMISEITIRPVHCNYIM